MHCGRRPPGRGLDHNKHNRGFPVTNRCDWWQGAIIYQIYPRSFLDTNGDGVGDLPGIVERLDYLASLGIDAIWISPFFKSPMADFGYDISDYRAVDPLFGRIEDFDRLLAEAHRRGLKVMIDQVLSHTSIEHPWFLESRTSRDNPRANWYVWADARADGGPPNNWLSIFGGVAWQWEPRRGQYYLHNFLAQQPDLNFHEPAVRQAALDNMRFWLDRGVDGFRLDAINFCFHDPLLRDNPPKPLEARAGGGFRADNPYAFQRHVFDNTRPENLEFLAEIRRLIDRYPGAVTLGEISSEDSLATMVEYTQPGRLQVAYSFELLGTDGSPEHIRRTVERANAMAGPSTWPCWAISNHDVERVASRWAAGDPPAHFATFLTAVLCSLRGTICIYQGEELGLTEAEVPFDALRDPYGIAFWPNFKGRDGCRTPMPWTGAAPSGGFSKASPWLPIPAAHLARSVDRQDLDPLSALNGFRRFLQWRKLHPELVRGGIRFVAATGGGYILERALQADRLIAAFNFTGERLELPFDAAQSLESVGGHGLPPGSVEGSRIVLPAFGAFFGRVRGSQSTTAT
ncbi:MAG: alpha-glucosidase [Gammaproteobacteria bacterium]|nr:alpha-glucosidase [Gammaproteobacteria bacterium]